MASIELRGVQKSFGATPVLRDVNLSIGDKEFCVFVGPSGCGKSTLLRIIAGLEDASQGDLLIGGQRMNTVPPADRGIAMVFQSYALFPHMSVYDNMAFGLQLAKRPKDEIDRRVREAARVLQLDALLDRQPKALSGGQRQRVAIGRAIVREPRVFLFDEPLSNLDTALRVQTRLEIARLHQDFAKASMVYVTHDQVEAMTLADKIVLLRAGPEVQSHGSLAQVGSPLALYHRPANVFAAGFIGSPKMNFLPATVSAATPERVSVKLADGTVLQARVDGRSMAVGAPVTLGLRPEHVSAAADQGLQARVRHVEHLGAHSYVYADLGRGTHDFCAAAPADAAARMGEQIRLGAPETALHVFDAQGQALPRTVSTPGDMEAKGA
jgi:multiple sugar transport system ATP-binding protein